MTIGDGAVDRALGASFTRDVRAEPLLQAIRQDSQRGRVLGIMRSA